MFRETLMNIISYHVGSPAKAGQAIRPLKINLYE